MKVFLVTRETKHLLLEILSKYKYNTKIVAFRLKDYDECLVAIPIVSNRTNLQTCINRYPQCGYDIDTNKYPCSECVKLRKNTSEPSEDYTLNLRSNQ